MPGDYANKEVEMTTKDTGEASSSSGNEFGVAGKFERKMTVYTGNAKSRWMDKVDAVADQVDIVADAIEEYFAMSVEKVNDTFTPCFTKGRECKAAMRSQPCCNWLCSKAIDPDEGALELAEGEELISFFSFRGLIDFIYLMVFFMGSAGVATVSLSYFMPKVSKESPEPSYSKSFLAADYCDRYDDIAGHVNLDEVRNSLTFFNFENVKYIFKNGKGDRCGPSLAKYGMGGLSPFSEFKRNITQYSGVNPDPFVYGGNVELIEENGGDATIMYAIAGNMKALESLYADMERTIELWNSAGIRSEVHDGFPDADPKTNWLWCMDTNNQNRTLCNHYIEDSELVCELKFSYEGKRRRIEQPRRRSAFKTYDILNGYENATNYECTQRSCRWFNYDMNEGDWGYLNSSNGDCLNCARLCDAHSNCAGFECGDEIGYCSYWSVGKCSIMDAETDLMTCRACDDPVYCGRGSEQDIAEYYTVGDIDCYPWLERNGFFDETEEEEASCLEEWVGDGFCDEVCNNGRFDFDGGDCATETGCHATWLGDGECDEQCNTAEFNYDKGDCGFVRRCNDWCFNPAQITGEYEDWRASVCTDDSLKHHCGGCSECEAYRMACTSADNVERDRQLDIQLKNAVYPRVAVLGETCADHGYEMILNDTECWEVARKLTYRPYYVVNKFIRPYGCYLKEFRVYFAFGEPNLGAGADKEGRMPLCKTEHSESRQDILTTWQTYKSSDYEPVEEIICPLADMMLQYVNMSSHEMQCNQEPGVPDSSYENLMKGWQAVCNGEEPKWTPAEGYNFTVEDTTDDDGGVAEIDEIKCSNGTVVDSCAECEVSNCESDYCKLANGDATCEEKGFWLNPSGVLMFNHGYVCDDFFGAAAGTVACNEMGLNYVSHRRYVYLAHDFHFTMDNLKCPTDSTSLKQCTYLEPPIINRRTEGVYLECGEKNTGFSLAYNGLLKYGDGYVCNHYFSDEAGKVACNEMGMRYVSWEKSVGSSAKYTLGNLECDANATTLSECSYSENVNYCAINDAVHLTCTAYTGPNDYECSLATCSIDNKDDEGVLFGFYDTMDNDCAKCQERCDADDNCGAVMCGERGSFCAWWATGNCSYAEANKMINREDFHKTCRKCDDEIYCGRNGGGWSIDEENGMALSFNDGYVCKDGFSEADARMICSSMGLFYESYELGLPLPDVNGTFSMTQLDCPVGSDTIFDCSYSTDASGCGVMDGVMLTCTGDEFSVDSEGLLLYRGGYVCDDYINDDSAAMLCLQMGKQFVGYKNKQRVTEDRPYSMEDLWCQFEGPRSIRECAFMHTSNCGKKEGLLVQCQDVDPGLSEEGNVGFSIAANGALRFREGYVCDDHLRDDSVARMVCNLLDMDFVKYELGFHLDSDNFSMDSLYCLGGAKYISDCVFYNTHTHNCKSHEGVYLECAPRTTQDALPTPAPTPAPIPMPGRRLLAGIRNERPEDRAERMMESAMSQTTKERSLEERRRPEVVCATVDSKDECNAEEECAWNVDEEIYTCGGNAQSKACQFPFTWEGVEYNSCTTVGHTEPWCFVDQAAGVWGNCNCPQLDDTEHGCKCKEEWYSNLGDCGGKKHYGCSATPCDSDFGGAGRGYPSKCKVVLGTCPQEYWRDWDYCNPEKEKPCTTTREFCGKFDGESSCEAKAKCDWQNNLCVPAAKVKPVECQTITSQDACFDDTAGKCQWNEAKNSCEDKPPPTRPETALKTSEFSLEELTCMKETQEIVDMVFLSEFVEDFNITPEDFDMMNRLDCIKDWAKSYSDDTRQDVFEMYILTLLFYVVLTYDMSQFVQKHFWQMVFRVTFSITYIYEFSLFAAYWFQSTKDGEWFDSVSWPYIDFAASEKSDEYVVSFINSIMVVRLLSVLITSCCVFFGKTKGSSTSNSEDMNASNIANLLYFILMLGLSTIVAVISLFAYLQDEHTDGIEASNFIGGTCGEGVMGKRVDQLYPPGWQSSPDTNWKQLNCINVKIGSQFQESINMYVIAYISTLLFYVYLLHNIRTEFTKRGAWVVFRLLFIIAFLIELAAWRKFHNSYLEEKMAYKTTAQIHPEASIVHGLTFSVFAARITVCCVLLGVQILEDLLCDRISDRICCEGKAQKRKSEDEFSEDGLELEGLPSPKRDASIASLKKTNTARSTPRGQDADM